MRELGKVHDTRSHSDGPVYKTLSEAGTRGRVEVRNQQGSSPINLSRGPGDPATWSWLSASEGHRREVVHIQSRSPVLRLRGWGHHRQRGVGDGGQGGESLIGGHVRRLWDW